MLTETPMITETIETVEATFVPSVALILQQVAARRPVGLAQRAMDVLERMVLCRTAPLGTRSYHCDPCWQAVKVYNSCGERHCPLCSARIRADWLERTVQWLVPRTPYLQIVFTVPGKTAKVLWQSRRAGYHMLMKTAWREVNRWLKQIGVQAGAIVVLHTWNQRLEHHPHLHVLIPTAGVSTDGSHWINYKKDPRLAPGNQWELGKRFRKSIIRRLKRLQKHGKLWLSGDLDRLNDRQAFSDYLKQTAPHGYRVFIQHPPTDCDDPQVVLKYLARYISGGPISDRRIVRHSGGKVTFRARPEQRSQDGRPQPQVEVNLPEAEFVRRWTLHILPKGFMRVRHYGQASAKLRKGYLARCRELLGIEHEPDDADLNEERPDDRLPEEPEPVAPSYRCPSCHQPMTCTQFSYRPSWKIIMANLRPGQHAQWYES